MLKLFVSLSALVLASAFMVAGAEVKTEAHLKNNYVFSDLSQQQSGNNSNVMLVRKSPELKPLMPSICLLNTKQFVTCRR
jgi:hypothetical protein